MTTREMDGSGSQGLGLSWVFLIGRYGKWGVGSRDRRLMTSARLACTSNGSCASVGMLHPTARLGGCCDLNCNMLC